jgi:hypothetical protein
MQAAFRFAQVVLEFELCVSKLASSAVLASAADTFTLQAQLLRNTLAADEDTCTSLNQWLSLCGLSAGDSLPIGNQRVLDSAVVTHTCKSQLNSMSNFSIEPSKTYGLESSLQWRLAPWHVMPISACGVIESNS